jgi:serine/threonine protein kinase/tetratricopeptide (TPR) repeat protein
MPMNNTGEKDDRLPNDEESVPTASIGPGIVGIGEKISRYKLLRILGEGGFGIVYLAEQQRPMKRQAALKIIKPGMDSAQIIRRFEAERQALALLDHPNVAHVYDAGTTEAGRPYFVMEYVKGVPITDHCDRQKFTIEERLKLFIKVCEAIQHAHQKGIIHRDIKPSNIQVCIQGEQFVPKVIDFGVAKALTQPLTERTLVTEQGQMLGTPEYISPEQAEMTNQDIDTRSDIYSLGVLLYELLTGTLPFESKILRKGTLEQMRKVIRETEPGAPSTRLSSLDADASTKLAKSCQSDTETLRRKLRGDLDWITLKAMEKDRVRRYQTAHALAEDVERHLNDEPVAAGPPDMLYRIQKLIRRHQALAASLTAVLLVLLTGIAGILIFAVKADRQASIAKAVTDFLGEDLLGAVAHQQAMNQEVTVRSILDSGTANLKDRFADQPLVEASVRHSLGKTYVELGRYTDAEIHLKRAYDLRRNQLGQKDLRTLDSMNQLGRLYLFQSHYETAMPLLAQAQESRNRIMGSDHADTLETSIWLGRVYSNLYQAGYFEKSNELLTAALKDSSRLLGEKNPITLEAILGLAMLRARQGKADEAASLCFPGWEMARELLGEGHRLTFEFMIMGAWLEARLGRFEEGQRHAQMGIETGQKILGEEHPHTIMAIGTLGLVYEMQYSLENAELWLSKSMQLAPEVLGEGNAWTLHHMFVLGRVYMIQGKYQQAKEILTNLREEGRRMYSDDYPTVRGAALRIIDIYAMQEQSDKLQDWCSQELQRLAQVGDGDDSSMAIILNHLAWLQATYPSDTIRDSAKAIENARKACDLTGWNKANFIDTLAAAYAEAGNYAAAVTEQERAIELVTHRRDISIPSGFERRRNLYKSGRAFRQSVLTSRASARIVEVKYDAAEQELIALLKSVREHLGQAHPETRGCILAFIELYEAWDKPEKAKEWRAKKQSEIN